MVTCCLRILTRPNPAKVRDGSRGFQCTEPSTHGPSDGPRLPPTCTRLHFEGQQIAPTLRCQFSAVHGVASPELVAHSHDVLPRHTAPGKAVPRSEERKNISRAANQIDSEDRDKKTLQPNHFDQVHNVEYYRVVSSPPFKCWMPQLVVARYGAGYDLTAPHGT